MAMSQALYPESAKRGIAQSAVYDTTNSLWYIPFGPVRLYFTEAAPASEATGKPGSLAIDFVNGKLYVDADGAGSWGEAT